MSVGVDASSPARFSGVLASGGTTVSASFTAPANSLIVVCVESDGATASQGAVTNVVTDSGGLTWTKQVERTVAEATDGGMSAIWTAPQASSAARTVTITHTRSSGADIRVTGKVYVVTGTSLAVDTVAAANEGGSATNNLTTTSITPGGTGLLIAADCDWTAGGDANHEAGDLTQDTTFWAGLISVCDGYKACTEAVAVTANLNAGGAAAAQHKWCQIVVREPPVYPQLRGVGAFGSGTTSFVAAVPTGGSAPVAGDAMFIIMESSDSSTTAGTPTTPGGWSKLGENTIGAGATDVSTMTIFGKIAGAGEGNVTVNGVGDHCAGAMVVVYNHGLSVITDTVVGAFTDHGTSTTNVLAASITVTAKSFIITAMGLSDDAADTTNVSGVTNANLAGITERIDQCVATGAGGGVGIYTATCAGTTTGTTEWDHDTAVNSQSMQIGIPPAAGGTVYTETGLAIAAAATVTLSDLERYKDLALAVGAVGVVAVADIAHYREIGLAVPVSALVTAAEAQHYLETGLPIPVTGTVSGSDAKKFNEAGLQITAVGTVAEADLQHFVDAGLPVTAAGTVSLTDALHALDLGLPVTIVGTASVSDQEHYQDLALAVPVAAVLSAAVAQHYKELGLPITAAVTAALADVEHYLDTALGVSVAALVSLASEVFHGSNPTENLALTAVASVAVTDLQRYLEASLPVSAQAVLAAVDKEHYQDAVQVLLAATLTASDVQHWGEALEALATGQVLLTDAQRYREIGLLVSAVATIGVVDTLRLSRLGMPVVIFIVPTVERTFQVRDSVRTFDAPVIERTFTAPVAERVFVCPAVQRVFGG